MTTSATSTTTTTLGKTGPTIGRIGLGCMGMSEFYGPADDAVSTAVIHRAIDLGVNFFDTADMYGNGQNERLVGQALAGRRERVVVATKFGIRRDGAGGSRFVDGTPTYVKKACEASLLRLGLEHIDLYYQHRVDPSVPIEDTVGAMSELVREGKVRFIGLSEAAAGTIRRAHAVHPIAALQTELSLWSREPERELIGTCAELGVTYVAYSPLGRGFLTGKIRSPEDLPQDDYRRSTPRFERENFQKNLARVARVESLASSRQLTTAQVALAWVLSRGEHVVAIPGTRSEGRLAENLGALAVRLSADELRTLDELIPQGAISGERYPRETMGSVDR